MNETLISSPGAALSAAAGGFLLWASLIIAIGPQNALVIKQGLKKQDIVPVILVCMISDLFFVFGGIFGVGAIIERVPWLLEALRWAGAAFLLWFAIQNFREARTPAGLDTASGTPPESATTPNASELSTSVRARWRGPVVAALAMTWLNPAAFVDGFVMLGGVANQYGDEAWAFALGALVVTVLWFPLLGFGAKALSRPLSKAHVWQKINIGIGVIMLLMAIRLAFFH